MAMQNPSGGSIIGVSSISALVGGGLQAHYTPTKAGILSLMQSCAVALGKHNIRCNALLPGTIKTQLNEEDLNDEEKRRYTEGRIPLGRTGVPEDMVGPAVFLAGDLSRYVVNMFRYRLCVNQLADNTRLERSCLLTVVFLSIYSESIPRSSPPLAFVSLLLIIRPTRPCLSSSDTLLEKIVMSYILETQIK